MSQTVTSPYAADNTRTQGTASAQPRPLVVVIMAAGLGTRMRSSLPKVLHPVAGRPMVRHVLDALAGLEPARVVVVVGPDTPAVAEAVAPHPVAIQRERLGTAHAALAAESALEDLLAEEAGDHDVLILCGDTPLVTGETLARLRAARAQGADLAALGFEAAEPGAYGRMVVDGEDRLQAVVEAKDASAEQLAIRLCNAGVLLADLKRLFAILARIDNKNAKGEYYLTDAFALAGREGMESRVVRCREDEMLGVNSRAELAVAEAVMQNRLRAKAMAEGVSLIAPETVWLSMDTVLAPDVVIEPQVVIGPGVVLGEGARIRAFSHLEGARVEAGAVIGPYARLRPGAQIGPKARVGNFVEVKNAVLAEGAKANHLSYLGDASVGAHANVGAGTITCNYDGYGKHRTVIGEGAFIGSNTALVAPVTVGAGAIVGAGSTITRDVEGDAIAVTRAEQKQTAGAAARFRGARQAAKQTKPAKE